MPRIQWVEDSDASGELAELYSGLRTMDPFKLGHVPEVFRAMSQSPQFLKGVLTTLPAHFSSSALSYPQKEMIASYVSAITKCHF
jgi:hypothetical protein